MLKYLRLVFQVHNYQVNNYPHTERLIFISCLFSDRVNSISTKYVLLKRKGLFHFICSARNNAYQNFIF